MALHAERYARVRPGAGDSLYFDSETGCTDVDGRTGRCRVITTCIPRSREEPFMIGAFVHTLENRPRATVRSDKGAAAPKARAPARQRKKLA